MAGGGLHPGGRAGAPPRCLHGPQDRPPDRGVGGGLAAHGAAPPAGHRAGPVRGLAHDGRGPAPLRARRLLVLAAGQRAPPVPAQDARAQRSAREAGPRGRPARAAGHGDPGPARPACDGRRLARRAVAGGRLRVRDEPDGLGLAEAGARVGAGQRRRGVRLGGRAVQRGHPGHMQRAGLRRVRERAGPAPVPGLPEVRPDQLRGDARAPAPPPVRDRGPAAADGAPGPAVHPGRLVHLHGDAHPGPAAEPAEPQGGVPAVARGPVPVLHVPGQGQQRRVLLDPDGDGQRRAPAGPRRPRVHVRRREQRRHQRGRRAHDLDHGHQRVHAPAGAAPAVRARGLAPDPDVPGVRGDRAGADRELQRVHPDGQGHARRGPDRGAVPDARRRGAGELPQGRHALAGRGRDLARVQRAGAPAHRADRAPPAHDGRVPGVPDRRGQGAGHARAVAEHGPLQPARVLPQGRRAVRVRGPRAADPGPAPRGGAAGRGPVVHGRPGHARQQQPAVLRPQPLHVRRAPGQVLRAAGLHRVRRARDGRLPVRAPQRPRVREPGGDDDQRAGQVPRELHQEALGPLGVHALPARLMGPGRVSGRPRDPGGRGAQHQPVPVRGRLVLGLARAAVPRGVPARRRRVLGGVLAVRAPGDGAGRPTREHGRLPRVLRARGQGSPRVRGVRGRHGAGGGLHAARAPLEPPVGQRRPAGHAAPRALPRHPPGRPRPGPVRPGARGGHGRNPGLAGGVELIRRQPRGERRVLQRGGGRAAPDDGLHVHGPVLARGLLAHPRLQRGGGVPARPLLVAG